MYTRCSHCHAAHEISPEALLKEQGHMHCRLCARMFDALEHLTRDAPEGLALAADTSTHAADIQLPEISLPDIDLPTIPATAAPSADTPDSPRNDALVDVLTAHADFIEPEPLPFPNDDRHTITPSAQASAPYPPPADAISPGQPQPENTDHSAEEESPAFSFTAVHSNSFHEPHDELPEHWQSAHTPDHPHEYPDSQATASLHHEPHHDLPAGSLSPDDLSPDDLNLDDLSIDSPGTDALPHHTPDEASLPGDNLTDETPSTSAQPTLSAPTPSFIPDTSPQLILPSAPGQRRWPHWLAIAALLLLLTAQSIYAERNQLAADARWRPWLERACHSLGCTLPLWHAPDSMHLMTRDVRPHPSVPDALLISASFRNNAPWAQAWPNLYLSLSDLNGQTIAQREFAPQHYLGISPRDLAIQPGQTASITLEVRDPGKQAVAFEFDFR